MALRNKSKVGKRRKIT